MSLALNFSLARFETNLSVAPVPFMALAMSFTFFSASFNAPATVFAGPDT